MALKVFEGYITTLTNVLRYSECWVFVLLGAVTFRRWWQNRRRHADGWLAVAFGTLAAIMVASLALPQSNTHRIGAGDPYQWFIKFLVVVLLLFPYFLFRFMAALHSPSRRTERLGGGLSLAMVVATFSLPYFPATDDHHRPWWLVGFMLIVIVQWCVLSLAFSVELWRSARGRPNVSRRRKQSLSLAGLALIVAMVPSAFPNQSDNTSGAHLAGLLIGLSAASLFAIGLSPPGVLRLMWRRREEAALRDAEIGLMQADSIEAVLDSLFPHVATILDGDGAALLDRDGNVIVARGIGAETLRDLAPLILSVEVGDGPTLVAPGMVSVALSDRWLAVETSVYGPFFGKEESDLVATLAAFIDLAMARNELLEREHHQGLHDSLTGLPNRLLLTDRVDQALLRTRRCETGLAVLFIDLDDFKLVNDNFGHSVGDQLLIEVAARLLRSTRAEDTVARFGGDEFVVLIEQVQDEQQALLAAERLGAAVSAPMLVSQVQVRQTLSTGIALAFADAETSAEVLLRDADAAMYQAKQSGRGQFEVFREIMRNRVSERLDLEVRLRRAIDNGEIEVFYQPEIDIPTFGVHGFEALARWRQPEGRLHPPSDFIPFAEESGLILEIGTQVLSSACTQAAAWQREGLPSRIAVNLSAREVVNPRLRSTIAAILEQTGLAPESLCLEITETVLLADAETSQRALHELKGLGIRIAVDDFGTGYSSLLYLKQLPVDILKIDQTFVRGLTRNPKDRAIVSGVIDLAHALGLSTTAEGVESAGQLALLRELGCHRAQGYYWSPALQPGAVPRWVGDNSPSLDWPADEGQLEGPKLLIVDDDSHTRQVLSIALGGSRLQIREAADGREAIAVAREQQPDVVVLDLSLPGMGGLEALPRILAVAPQSEVVVFTNHELGEMTDRAKRGGAVAYFAKDREMEDLLAYVEPLLARFVA